jgi:protease IV
MPRLRSSTALLLLGCVVFASGALACEGRRRVDAPGATSREEPTRGPAITVLDLSDGVPERATAGFLGIGAGGGSMEQLIEEVEAIAHDAHDDRALGVLVRLGTARIGLARATEIGALLERLGGKLGPGNVGNLEVWCHADEMSNATIYLAARGCKRIWVSPGGTVDAIGLAAQMVYFHKLLADELGLDVDFLQVGKFKGAQEPFTRDGPSPEARASLETTLSGMRTAWIDGIHAARPAIADGAAEDGPYSAPGARERGLIDEIGYFDEARGALEKKTHAARAQVKIGPGSEATDGDPLSQAISALTGASMGQEPVVVVPAVGAISAEGSGVLGQGDGIVGRRLLSTLVRLEKDDDVKAVVLRIDSPGGSALASDLLWHALMRVRAEKPLVVSVGDMAASGGYYLASAGSVVYADDASIVGSIGVVGGKVAVGHALARIGVFADTVPAKTGDPRAGARAAYESLLTPWDDDTRRRLLETMTGIYELFLARIAEGRGIPVARVAESAEGRIFSGRDARARGLVDELGGLAEAIARARLLAGLPPDARVGIARDSSGLIRELLRGDAPQSRATWPLVGVGVDVGSMATVAPELTPFVASLAPLAGHEATLCAVPFALDVR